MSKHKNKNAIIGNNHININPMVREIIKYTEEKSIEEDEQINSVALEKEDNIFSIVMYSSSSKFI